MLTDKPLFRPQEYAPLPANTPSRLRHRSDITFPFSFSRRLEKDVWAAADGGVGSSDSEDETLYAEKTTTGIVVNHKAYEKLGNSVGGEGQVIYDSSDDD